MTEHRTRKRLVRERMARTGESYTTARRHVLARTASESATAPLPSGLLPGYDRFGGGQHHESTLLAHVLRQRGITAPHTGEPYTEAMLCGLGGGIGFMVAVFEYKGLPPMLTVVAQHHPEPWAPAVLDRLGCPYQKSHSSSTAAALGALRKELEAGNPVWSTIARSHAATGIDADAYPVVVAGRDGETLYLDDVAPAPRGIDEAAFGAAWSAHRKGRHERLTVTGTPTVELPDAIRAAIATTVAHLTGPVLGNAFDANFGISGMSRLAAQLRDRRSKTGWLRRFGTPQTLGVGLARLAECLEVSYTAPAATRPLYADFLDEAASLVRDAPLAEAATMFRASGALWSKLASRALEVMPPAYVEATEQRLAALFCGGPVPAGLPDATGDVDGIARFVEFTDLLDELADLVEEARHTEERAVSLLKH
jgi:hypothetical protein